MTIRFVKVPSPFGELTITSNGDAVTACTLDWRAPDDADVISGDDLPVLAKARADLAAYFAGALTDFDFPLAPAGTPFQIRAWREMRCIPCGQTVTYGELARKVGNPQGARAIGMACNRNPIMIIIPCHRVVGAGGNLTGYACGLPMKEALLALERR